MIKRVWATLFAAAVMMFAGGGCSAIQNLNMYSTREEVQLGNALDKEIRKQQEMLDDARLDSFVTTRGRALIEHSRRRDIRYFFTVVNDETVNAFAIPGGYCYINLGLFRKSKTEAELISVISHEVNHVVHQHSMKRLTQMNIVGGITEIVVGDRGATANLVANLLTTGGLLYYGREAEREADYDGLVTMYEAGYDPNGMVEMFKMLKAGRESEPSIWANLFSTHPMTDERIEYARRLIGQLPGKEGLIWNSPEWDGIVSYLNEKYPAPEKEND